MHDQFREEIGWRALNLYGPALGLPHAMGLTNSFWYRGYDPRLPQTVIVVGFDLDEGRKLFRKLCCRCKKYEFPWCRKRRVPRPPRHAAFQEFANALACLLGALPPLRVMSPAWVDPRLAVEFCFGAFSGSTLVQKSRSDGR